MYSYQRSLSSFVCTLLSDIGEYWLTCPDRGTWVSPLSVLDILVLLPSGRRLLRSGRCIRPLDSKYSRNWRHSTVLSLPFALFSDSNSQTVLANSVRLRPRQLLTTSFISLISVLLNTRPL